MRIKSCKQESWETASLYSKVTATSKKHMYKPIHLIIKRKQGHLKLFYGEGTDNVFKIVGHRACMAYNFFL